MFNLISSVGIFNYISSLQSAGVLTCTVPPSMIRPVEFWKRIEAIGLPGPTHL